jgi:mRNA interferase MazF
MFPKVGEVYMIDLGYRGKVRPAVVVSRDDSNPPWALSVMVPLTKQSRGSNYEVMLPRVPWLGLQSYANVLGINSVQQHELQPQLRRGRFEPKVVEQIKNAIRWTFNL